MNINTFISIMSPGRLRCTGFKVQDPIMKHHGSTGFHVFFSVVAHCVKTPALLGQRLRISTHVSWTDDAK